MGRATDCRVSEWSVTTTPLWNARQIMNPLPRARLHHRSCTNPKTIKPGPCASRCWRDVVQQVPPMLPCLWTPCLILLAHIGVTNVTT